MSWTNSIHCWEKQNLGGLSLKESKKQAITQVQKLRTKICEQVLNLVTLTQQEICYVVR